MQLTTSQLGNLGESKVITDFIRHGFDIYTQFSGNNPFDFVVHRDGKLWAVEVRTTTKLSKNNAYTIYLYGTSYGPDRTIIKKPLSNTINILAGYIVPLNVVCYLNRSDINSANVVTFREELSGNNQHGQRLIFDYINLENVL